MWHTHMCDTIRACNMTHSLWSPTPHLYDSSISSHFHTHLIRDTHTPEPEHNSEAEVAQLPRKTQKSDMTSESYHTYECVVKSHNSHGSCATSEVRLLKCDFWSATSEVRLPKCDFWSRTTPVGVVWLQSDFWVISHIWMCRVMTHDSSPVTHTRRSEQSTVPQSHRTHTSGFWVISHIWTSRVITHVSSLMTHTRRSEQSTVALVTELTRLAYELLSQYYIWMSHVMTHDVVSYGVATISRLLRMIGLFCKGAL